MTRIPVCISTVCFFRIAIENKVPAMNIICSLCCGVGQTWLMLAVIWDHLYITEGVGSENVNFPVLYVMKMSLCRGMGGSKKLQNNLK